MGVRIATLVFAFSMPFCVMAQQDDEPARPPEGQEKSEEIVVIGQRRLLQLRTQMWEVEKATYDVFNQFNDEKRFNITCSMHQPTGTRIERQICAPEFQRQATRAHARAYYVDLRDLLDPWTVAGTSPTVDTPFAAVIASQQEEYQSKMRQVAEEHPEFLDALIQYSEIREQYEEATRTGGSSGE